MHTNEHESESTNLDTTAEHIIGAAYEVSNTLGCGFLEKIYERALKKELQLRGLDVQSQQLYRVTYKSHPVGDYTPDLVVNNHVLVELKCADRLANEHTAQCINYLKASGLRLALLINFGRPKVEWKRLIYG
jgi:GxxExxY protein